MKLLLTRLSLRYPRLVLLLALLATLAFALQFPRVHFDNDPENMLAADEPVRQFHHQVKQKYALYDFVIVGIVNESHPAGVFNVDTLGRIDRLTRQLLHLQPAAGAVGLHLPGEPEVRLDLAPQSGWQRLLNRAFNHDPNRLFTADGTSALVAHELIAPSVVDNIKQAELGSLRLEYLMEQPPHTEAQARVIRDDAMGNPLYAGTLVSEDERALCLYLPIVDKTFSHNVANLVRHLTADWPAQDRVLITGLPVAEDTFGVEMLIQMATSAPLAGLAIFALLWLFFRSLALIVAPMVVALLSVICAMGLLIGLGYDVHIMSSMIAIFLMPIAVADSVHILSEFYDVYPRFGDKKRAVEHVIGHLFAPMLYTSLTTIAGFASLAFTPIPPVQVFGLHVAFGVAVAWLLSMTLIPAYIALAVSEERLASRQLLPAGAAAPATLLTGPLVALGRLTQRRGGAIGMLTLILLVLAGYGISRISVNDNPVKWFSPQHEIRQADAILNHHFGGTYTAYLTFAPLKPEGCGCDEKAQRIAAALQQRFGASRPAETAVLLETLQRLSAEQRRLAGCDVNRCFFELLQQAEQLDRGFLAGWAALADALQYLDPVGLDGERLRQELAAAGVLAGSEARQLLTELAAGPPVTGEALLDTALALCERHSQASFAALVLEQQAETTAPPFKRPEMLRYLEGLQQYLQQVPQVGKSSSVVDALKKAAYELSYREPPVGGSAAEIELYRQRNAAHFAVPATAAATAQVFVQLEGMKKKDSLFHLVTRDYREANLWLQLKSGDNRDMEQVVAAVEGYLRQNTPPQELVTGWAGLTYINVVWQDKMVRGMLSSLGGSFVVVLVMMMLLFRSPLWGALAMIPLSVTIALIYGIIGLVGKDYDMPVAVLSSLTLGLSVDFAIHFLQRARELCRTGQDWPASCAAMFREPARAISRNAITVAVGFTPLLLAPLVPYKTVGFFLATIMTVSWLATLLLLPVLVRLLRRWLFPPGAAEPKGE
ncbi:efflux RND transporter permease subunit [Desulfuromonas thiophila]|uniref:MMPL family protein n=1 Tax=Desulfuromonas thiophila TaxID=57664 RepID=A0A1G7EGJ3_9BACT|nr:MMPL family transporter [Desulfuromonas thiophila]SDE62799.1 MMPL family protein [Desulfuromonas thiophila]